jgi:extracellular elastinolytic metalloproteinase
VALLVCAAGASAAPPRSEPLRARSNGFLTRPSDERPAAVALGYVRAHPDTFKLDPGDVAGLRLVRSYRSGGGDAHLQWEQVYRGIPVFGPGLRANVAADGRLINVGEGAIPDPGVKSIEPRLSAREAAGPQASRASLTLFGGHRLAWRVLLRVDPTHVYDAVVDANTGESLYRVNMVKEANAAHVFENYPGALLGGTRVPVSLGLWLSSTTTLSGPYAHVYADPDDDIDGFPDPPDGMVTDPDEIHPNASGDWDFPYDARPASAAQHCPTTPGCSWDHSDPAFSWTVNRDQEGTQLFYYVNRYHDHLRDTPGIGFGQSSNNFEGIDAVQAQVDDGAATDGTLPACGTYPYANNAYAIPVPEGEPLLLQFYVWSNLCTGGNEYDVNPVDDALIVYHEYTHGMTNRLVTDAGGYPALNGAQPAAMDEGLADFFALDFLVAQGLEPDTAVPGELRAGVYEHDPLRSQAWDCPVGADASACPGHGTAGSGGYTYADFGKISGLGPEVHADGEIWVETLWDLRTAEIAGHGASAGLTRTRALVTDGLRLAPANPTFLGLRDAILQANTLHGYGDRDRIWAVFAHRGMGYNASTTGADDTTPFQSFALPPPRQDTTPPPRDRTRPALSRTSLTKRRIKVGTRTAFKFTLSEVATVEIALSRAQSGRRSKGRCLRSTRKLRKRPRCTRYVGAGSLVKINMSAGAHSVGFAGKLRRHALPTGAYKVTIRATDAAGNRSRPVTTTLRIVRR